MFLTFPQPDLLIARIAFTLAESVFKEALEKAVLVDREGKPTDNFDQSVVDTIFHQLLDSHILKVLNDDDWLEWFVATAVLFFFFPPGCLINSSFSANKNATKAREPCKWRSLRIKDLAHIWRIVTFPFPT